MEICLSKGGTAYDNYKDVIASGWGNKSPDPNTKIGSEVLQVYI